MMDSLEEDLTCSVCYALFTDPRVLPCSHTFCKSCLESVLQVSSNYSIWRPLRLPLKCPNCRSVAELPPTGVDALPVNVSLRAIIEKFQRDGGAASARPPTCPEHPRQPLNVYCVQDRALICGLCLTVGRHQGHAIDDLQAAYVRERHAPEQLVQQLTDARWAEVCALGERLEEEKARGEGLVRQDREAVALFFRGAERLLGRKRDEYLAALDAVSEELARTYDPLVERLKDVQEEQLSLIALGSAVRDEEEPLAFLEKVHLFRARVASLTQTPMPQVVPVYIAPRAADFLRERWAKVTVGGLEHAPVPKVALYTAGCCAGKRALPAGLARGWLDPRRCPLPLVALLALLLLLLLAAGLHLDLFGVASLGFSVLASLGEVLRSLADQLVWPFNVQGLLEDLLSNVCASVSSLADRTYQHLAFFLQASQ
ncbi:tripartite motif-containing protein 59 [Sardina pilchardus]|uniref:tripartite motif-containing protein 59 n=1 Tax=Sardina pilchardus TaxID=27697 RepID=UPI002E0E4BE6